MPRIGYISDPETRPCSYELIELQGSIAFGLTSDSSGGSTHPEPACAFAF